MVQQRGEAGADGGVGTSGSRRTSGSPAWSGWCRQRGGYIWVTVYIWFPSLERLVQTERWVHLGHGALLVHQRGEAGADREVGTSGSRCRKKGRCIFMSYLVRQRREAGADREVSTPGSHLCPPV